MKMKWMAALVALLMLAGCGGAQQKGATTPTTPAGNYQKPAQTQTQPQAQTPAPPKTPKQWKEPPAMAIDVNKKYFATLKTDQGDIKVELLVKDAPKTVNNFVFLAKEGFYDGVTFHRIIKGFMIQGGDPLGNGTGGPGYRFADELPPKYSYDPGIVAMANAGPNTQGSQFFICNGPGCAANLNPQPYYTQFGRVVEGMDVVQKISNLEVVPGGEATPSKPKVAPVIKSVVIEEK